MRNCGIICGMERIRPMFYGVVEHALESVVKNKLPMVVLWFMAAMSVAAYWLYQPFADMLEPLARWQTQDGWIAAALNRIVFCGLLPGVFLCTVRSIRPGRPLLTVCVFCAWAAQWGILCDIFFTVQAKWFGYGHGLVTVVLKTLVDQLVWTAFLCTPVNALFFTWVANDFRRIPLSTTLREKYMPMLFANWIVWLPVSAAVYMFPLPLQIQLIGLAGAFWMLVALAAGMQILSGKESCLK